jgi:hypothetical protein
VLGIEGSFLHHFRKKVEPFIDPSPKPGTNTQCSEITPRCVFGDQSRYNRGGR